MATTLAPRPSTSDRWDKDKELNSLTEKFFKDSIEDFLSSHANVEAAIPEIDNRRIWNSPEFQDTPYGVTTLGQSGCAVYCFFQAIRLQRGRTGESILDFASEVAQKRYYEPGKGTYHNLFDKFGLRRASHIQELFDTFLYKKGIVTVLVRNAAYLENDATSGRHFINIIGNTSSGFYVDDPNLSRTKLIPFEELLPAIDIAWIW